MNKIISLFVILACSGLAYGVVDSFGALHIYYASDNCSTPTGGDYSNFVRPGMCWDYGDGTWFSGESANNTLTFSFSCTSDTCSDCSDESYPEGSCQNLGGGVTAFAESGVTEIIGAYIGAYFTGDPTCNISSLSQAEAMNPGFCYALTDNYANFACDNNQFLIFNCSDSLCLNCIPWENHTIGACVNSAFGLGATRYFCNSYSPFLVTTTTTASATTTTTAAATTTTSTTAAAATTTTTAAAATTTTSTTAAAATTTSTTAAAATTTTSTTAAAATTTTSTTAAAATTTTTSATSAAAATTTTTATTTATSAAAATSTTTSTGFPATTLLFTTSNAFSIMIPICLVMASLILAF